MKDPIIIQLTEEQVELLQPLEDEVLAWNVLGEEGVILLQAYPCSKEAKAVFIAPDLAAIILDAITEDIPF